MLWKNAMDPESMCVTLTGIIFVISDLVSRLERDGKISKLDGSVAKELLSRPLKCHRCSATPKTIPELKTHLLKHLSEP